MISTNRFSRLKPLFQFLTQAPVVLLGVGLLTYGVFIPLLNFYWDDLSIHWIAEIYGGAGLARYFSTNRPVWGIFYQFNAFLLGDAPWAWQIFGIFWRWVAATGLYYLLKQLFSGRQEPALWGSMIFMVFPGFSQQYIAMVYGHFFLVFSAFFYSLVFQLAAREAGGSHRKRNTYHILALLLSAINLFSMEYFFMLELLRPLILWMKNTPQKGKQRIQRTFLEWVPYLVVFLAAGIWRAFIFNFQTENYDPQFLNMLRAQPLAALWGFLVRMLQDMRTILLLPWANAFTFPNPASFGQRAILIVSAFSLILLIGLSLLAVFHLRKQSSENNHLPWNGIFLAGAAFLLAGVPFWLTNLPVNLYFPYDRFTIPFTLAFVLFWVTLLFSFPINSKYIRPVFILLVVFSAAHQLKTGVLFQRDWEQQSRFFWQLVWRAPSIKPGTILFAHEMPIVYFSDGTLTSALNWVYDPKPSSDVISYALYYPTLRVGGTVEALQPDQAVNHDLLVGTFQGNTSQSLALVYQPPACLRVLDPEIELDNWMVPVQVREATHLTDTANILPEPQAIPPAFLYDPEPDHNWCYYFQKADLARQQGDWNTVLEIAQTAFLLDDKPNDPAERFPFIEGYAHSGDWDSAMALTREAADITPVMLPVLCRLWERIDRETSPGSEHTQAVNTIRDTLSCSAQP